MKATITSNLVNDILVLKTSGKIDSWEQFSELLYEEALKHNTKNVITDHRDLEFPAEIMRAADLVGHYQNNMPIEMTQLKLAAVMRQENMDLANFWETYCNNRGFHYKAFTSISDATKWLMA